MRTHVIAAAILLAALAPAAFADYTTTILTPPPTGVDVGNATANAADAAFNGQQAGAAQVNGSQHAYYWNGSAPGTDLNGPNPSSGILALSGTQAAGYVTLAGAPAAAIWLLPLPLPQLLPNGGYSQSEATALGGSSIAGFGVFAPTGTSHALFWANSGAAPIDLHNFAGAGAVYSASAAAGTDGVHVVGNATFAATAQQHAMFWNTANSTATDLQNFAVGLQNSLALSMAGSQIVGYGLTDPGNYQALLWTVAGPQDNIFSYAPLITPAGFVGSAAQSTNGLLIVGEAIASDGTTAALLWTTPGSYEFLPTPVGDSSQALGIDAAGDIVGTLTNSATGQQDAVLWTPGSSPVPEPASLALLLPAGALVFRRRLRH